MLELRDVLLTLGVSDLRFYGSAQTWTNKCPEDPITKKLDRALVNDHWLTMFPFSSATFQVPQISYHSPCVIRLETHLPSSASKPYKFFNYLVRHPNILVTVKDSWVECGIRALDMATLCHKLKSVKSSLKSLDRENFSDIQVRITEIYLLLQIAQEQALASPSTLTF